MISYLEINHIIGKRIRLFFKSDAGPQEWTGIIIAATATRIIFSRLQDDGESVIKFEEIDKYELI